MITTARLADTAIITWLPFLFHVKTFKIYSFSNFQVYNTILLTIITILFIRSPELIHFLTGSLYSLVNISPFPLPCPTCPTPSNYHSTLFLQFSSFIPHTTDIIQYLFLSLWLISCNIMPSRSIHVVSNGRISFFLMAEKDFIYMYLYTTFSSFFQPLMDIYIYFPK